MGILGDRIMVNVTEGFCMLPDDVFSFGVEGLITVYRKSNMHHVSSYMYCLI
jgi:uncharacterized membrane protein